IQSAGRKEYNKGAKLRNALRGDDVIHVEEYQKTRKHPLMELTSSLNSFEIRHRGHNNKKKSTAEKRVPADWCVPYCLPLELSTAPYGDTIGVSKDPDSSEECWLVDIEGIGEFNQRRLICDAIYLECG
ncbi:hypothetical protein JG687_00001757, partial [Phytophthora cactorum]